MLWVVSLLALALSVGALALGVRAVRPPKPTSTAADALPEDVLGLRQEVAALAAESRSALRHLAVVRYDAFGDVGGHLSWSLALLDDAGNGAVLTSIHGRTEARTYAKYVNDWSSDQQLSPEETEAIATARPQPTRKQA